MEYKFSEIENKWKKFWEENEVYKVTEDPHKPKYYVLDMFPYPSGAGLHVGHPLGYVASDIYARYKRLKGFNVLHPMGWDAFGLPAEQYAIETGTHPRDTTEKAITRYREQMDKIGFSFDWSREVRTCEPNYYKWTQWIFLKLYNSWYNKETNKAEPIETLVEKLQNTNYKLQTNTEKTWNELSEAEKQHELMNYRLAFQSYSEVNWCAALGTVLANDEIKDGKSERGGHPIERRKMRQWFLRITEYSDRLLDGLEKLDWSDAMKEMQRNWIGRSEGASIQFGIQNSEFRIEVFTTRPDTIFGATFMVIAAEHELVNTLTTPEQKAEVDKYIAYVKSRTDVERQQEKKVTGVPTGSYAVNPFTNENIPVYIAEYVLGGYGTGAIMAVPADDERDKKFAEKFGLKIVDIVDKSMYPGATIEDKLGKMINSGFVNGMEVKDAIKAVIAEIEKRGIGKKKVNYKQRDAGYSRQRYWGEPFPIILTPNPSPKERGETANLSKMLVDDGDLGYMTGDNETAKKNLTHAKDHRKNPTEAEDLLWQNLRNENLGEKFRRQHLIDKYIVDFVCLQKALVVEVDGEIHNFQKEEDEARTYRLNQLGYKVIRFTNNEVLTDVASVNQKIKEALHNEGAASPLSFGEGQGVRNESDFLSTPLSESQLPLVLPEVSSYKPTGDGRAPLANNADWVKNNYETDTMPGYAASSWYFLRYMDPKNDKEFAAKDKIDYWKNVDIYFGGAEHAVGHLLYSRFWNMFLYDLGLVPFEEPFKKLVNQGMIQGVGKTFTKVTEGGVTHETERDGSLKVSEIFCDGNKEFNELVKLLMPENGFVIPQSKHKSNSGLFAIYVSADLLSEFHIPETNLHGGWRIEADLCDGNSLIMQTAVNKSLFLAKNVNHFFVCKNGIWANDIWIGKESPGQFFCNSEVEKMSKSKYNVVNPDDVIEKHGADCFRMFEMFLGPIEQSKPWDDKGISGVSNFLRKFWRLFYDDKGWKVKDEEPTDAEYKVLHKTLKKIVEDIERLNFNTSVSAFMIATNELGSLNSSKKKILEPLLIALAPFAPFITEELWSALGNKQSIHTATYPTVEEKYLVENSHTYAVSINGKVRAEINLPLDISPDDAKAQVLALEKVKQWTQNMGPKKFIFVKGKIINVVV